jgi:hypothetical protein
MSLHGNRLPWRQFELVKKEFVKIDVSVAIVKTF